MTKAEAILVQRLLSYVITQMPPAESETSAQARKAAMELAQISYLATPKVDSTKVTPPIVERYWTTKEVEA